MSVDTFDHRAHVHLAWDTIGRSGVTTALLEVPAFLRGVAFAAGRPDRYHETLTLGFVLLVADRCADPPHSETFDAFVARNPELLDPTVIDRYWTAAALSSERARRGFVFPDR